MFKRVTAVVACVMLAIALAPNVPTALATAHIPITPKDTLERPVAAQPRAAFEALRLLQAGLLRRCWGDSERDAEIVEGRC